MKEQLDLLPGYLSAHVRLVTLALLVSTLVSIPLGVAATRSARLERVIMSLSSVVQTIPALALLAVMVPVLGSVGLPAIGALPALLGLALYCSLPILMSTVTAVREVDKSLLEAARAVGMTEREVLRLVELPVAAPFIVSGVRTATVWCVGMATLSTPIGAPSLGNFIFGGLQTRNHAATLTGCVAAAVLALLLDALVRLVETGLRKRNRAPLFAGGAGLAALLLFTVGSFVASAAASAGPAPIRIGAKSYTEQYVLGQVLSKTIQAKTDNQTEVIESLGSSVVFDALVDGSLDVYVDYTGTVWTTVLKKQESAGDRAALLKAIESELDSKYGVKVVASLGFENTYCLAVRSADSKRLGLKKISDLTVHAPKLVVGADYEFFSRAEWSGLKDIYKLSFRDKRSMDPALMYQAVRESEVDVISAFSTDGRIAAFDLTVLEDDRAVIPPYDAIVLVSGRLAKEHPDVVEALSTLGGAIDAAKMREMNRAVDDEKRTPAAVAEEFLRGR